MITGCDKHSGLPGALARDGSCRYCEPDGRDQVAEDWAEVCRVAMRGEARRRADAKADPGGIPVPPGTRLQDLKLVHDGNVSVGNPLMRMRLPGGHQTPELDARQAKEAELLRVLKRDEERKKVWHELVGQEERIGQRQTRDFTAEAVATITAVDRHAGTVTFSSDESAFAEALRGELGVSELAAWTPRTVTGDTLFGVDYGVFVSTKLPETPASKLLALEGWCCSGLLNRDGARELLGGEPPEAWFEDEDAEEDDLGGCRAVVGSVDGAEGSIRLHRPEDVCYFEAGDALYTRQDVLKLIAEAREDDDVAVYMRDELLSGNFVVDLACAFSKQYARDSHAIDAVELCQKLRAALSEVLNADEKGEDAT